MSAPPEAIHVFQPLFRALFRHAGMKRQIVETLAHLERQEEISEDASDELLPQIAPHLSEEDRNFWFSDLKEWLLLRDRANVQLGQPSDLTAEQWVDRCQAGVDEALGMLAGEHS